MAITSSEIRAAWQTHIWTSATVQAITPNVFLHDVSPEGDSAFAGLQHEGSVNFFICKTLRKKEPLMGGQVRHTFQVVVEYYLQQSDDPEETYNDAVDRLEAVDDLILSTMGATWSGEVDYYQGGTPEAPKRVVIDQLACWKGAITYTALKTT